jgi:uncharacterized phage protein (TIGR01671 family)
MMNDTRRDTRMREYRFRGKSIETLVGDDQWLYGFGVQVVEMANGDKEYWLYTDGGTYQVDPETVGQYTGLKDRNDKEIYEGDINKQTYHTEVRDESWDHEWISFDGHHLGEVVITARGVCMKNPLHYSMETDETNLMKAYKQVAGYRSEVIGNRWDNPDLLEGKENGV